MEKYDKESNDEAPDIRSFDVLDELEKGRAEFLGSIKDIPKERYSITKEEFNALHEVSVLIKKVIHEQRGLPIENLYVLINKLDSLDLWKSKFSTECAGGPSNSVELQESSSDDSIYYMTLSGATLRLKMVNINEGLESVIQPFMEKVIFESPSRTISEIPQIGHRVSEYFSLNFNLAIQEGDVSLYKPVLDIYQQDRKIKAVTRFNEKTGFISPSVDHYGDRVNKLFFTR